VSRAISRPPFKEGDLIKQGAPLYRIEKGLFQAQVEQAEGALERSKAAKISERFAIGARRGIGGKQAGTVVARDQARAQDPQAHGPVMADEANVAAAKINLRYADIASPITGRVGRTSITKGNVVSPKLRLPDHHCQPSPMYVTFPVSQREFLRAEVAAGKIDLCE
jgi:membrane fusion protein (multidrug efflux system)